MRSKPRTAYNFFFSEKNSEIRQQNPDMRTKDIMKEIGRLWKEASPEEKEKYEKKSIDDRAQKEVTIQSKNTTQEPPEPSSFESKQTKQVMTFSSNQSQINEKHQYLSEDSDEESSKPIQKSKIQRPKTAYNFFFSEKNSEIRQQNPDMRTKDIMKEIGRLWKEASPEEKEKYEKKSIDDRAQKEVTIQSKNTTQEPPEPSSFESHQTKQESSFKKKKKMTVKNHKRKKQIKAQYKDDFADQVALIVNKILDNNAPQNQINKLCDLIQLILSEQVKFRVNQLSGNCASSNFMCGPYCTGNNCFFPFSQPQIGFANPQFMSPYGSYFIPSQMQTIQQPY